ncbi:MAG: spore germination protein GerW family protein [Clostridia bacterium]
MKIDELVSSTLKSVRDMLDVNMVVGKPIYTDEVVVIPITKLSLGFANGTASINPKENKGFDQMPISTVGGGANIDPIGFLVINEDKVKFLPIEGGEVNKWSNLVSLAKNLFAKE